MDERTETGFIVNYLLGEGVIAYQRGLARAVGNHSAGLLLSQFWYWAERLPGDRDGWFFMTQEQIFEETVMTRREQETARKRLREKGVLEEKKCGVPARLWFRINRQAVVELLQKRALSQDGGKRQTRMAESAKLESPKATYKPGGFRQTKESKISSEITTETTAAEAGRENRNGHPTKGSAAALIQELLAHDLNRADAVRLAKEKPEECRRQLDFLPFKTAAIGGEQYFTSGKGAYLRAAIEGGFAPPPGYRQAQARRQKAEQEAERKRLTEARRSHQERFFEAYRDYLRGIEEELATGFPEAYRAFRDQEQRTRTSLGRLRVKKPLEEFETEAAHLERLVEFFRQVPDSPVLDFWEWDACQNPQPFVGPRENPPSLPAGLTGGS